MANSAHFFPAGSRLDVERPSSLRRTPTRSVVRSESSDDTTTSDGRSSRPSNINWLQNPLAASQAGAPMPKRPPSARLGRSASLSAIPGPSPLRRQSSLISNHSLQLDRLVGSHTDGPSALSPISEQSYVPTPTSRRDLFPTDAEPSTPVSVASTYSAFLRRPLKRSISATSTSSHVTSIYPPTLPPLNITPLDIRPVYPPVSHRVGPQLFSTVYEDTGSERTGSFVTAHSVTGDEDNETPAGGNAVDVRGPSGSTTLYSPAALRSGAMGPFTDSDDLSSIPFTTTPPSGNDDNDDSGSSSGAQARPRPRPSRVPTSGNNNNNNNNSGSGTASTFILRRLTFGSALSRPSFSAARAAVRARLPPLPVLLFWAGFVAPWCWLIGGWLIAEGRWEESGKARAALPLWRARRRRRNNNKGKSVARRPGNNDPEKGRSDGGAGAGPAAGAQAQKTGEGGEGEGEAASVHGRSGWWSPFAATSHAGHGASRSGEGEGGAAQKEKVVTLVKPYSAEVWVYRCRLAAVISALMLLTALIVTLVIVGGSSH